MIKVKLGDYVEVDSGFAFKSNLFSENEGIPLIRIRDVNAGFSKTYYTGDYSEKYIVNNGDLLITMDGEFNIREWNGGRALLNQRVCRIKSKTEMLNKRYLLYLLPKVLRDIEDKTPFVTVKHLSVKDVIESLVYIPNITIQNKIVEVLDIAKDLIIKRKNQIEFLSILTQSIFLEMFGDPQVNNKNWNVGIIKDLTLKTQYGTSKKADDTDGKYPILRMNNISYEGRISLKDLKYIDLDEKEAEKYLVHKSEILFNRTNSKELVGKTAVYNFEEPVAFAGYLVKLIPNDKANAAFISAYLNSSYGKRVLLNKAKSIVGMANINAEELKEIPIYIPPIELQNEFSVILENIERKRQLLNKSLVQLENNFNSLMQSGFKGDLFTN